MDSLLLFQKLVHLYEVKNFEGDYYIENDIWYSASGNMIKDPLKQLSDNESALKRLLQEFGLTYSIEPYLVFINPEFTLYNAPRNSSIILPTQLNRFMKKMNRMPSRITEKHSMFSEHLMLRHLEKSPYSKVPNYSYDTLRKGMFCKVCYGMFHFSNERLICTGCGCEESLDSTVLRSIEEFVLLFPNMKLSVNTIFDWCSVVPSKKTIRRILKQHYDVVIKGKESYYVIR
jgi:hypothetical protein